jgi:hypothetical protein
MTAIDKANVADISSSLLRITEIALCCPAEIGRVSASLYDVL